MSVTADRKNYEAPLILIHWPMALLIFGLYAVGLSIDVFDKPLRPPIVNFHAIFGPGSFCATTLSHA
jgi:cytochrome b561